MSLIFNSKSVYPGEELHLEAVLVGELFGTGMGSIYAQFMDPGNKKVASEIQIETLKPC